LHPRSHIRGASGFGRLEGLEAKATRSNVGHDLSDPAVAGLSARNFARRLWFVVLVNARGAKLLSA